VEASGELQGVAVGVKLLSVHGVLMADGVAALIPRSLSILARPRHVEKVVVELRRLKPLSGVAGAVLCRLLAVPVHIWLPRKLKQTNLRIRQPFLGNYLIGVRMFAGPGIS